MFTMKSTFLFAALFAHALSLNAQQTSICAYYGDNSRYTRNDICNYMKFESNDEAEKVVDGILQQVGLKRNFIVMECPNIENALAVNLPSDIGTLRYIIYDNNFLDKVERRASTDWTATSILAHEIAHHLNGHTLDFGGSRPDKELEADEFSGFVLYKLGASLSQAQAAINSLQSEQGSASHPAKSRRLSAIAKGWRDAQALAPKTSANPSSSSLSKGNAEAAAKELYNKAVAEKDFDKMVEYCNMAIALKPDYPDPYYTRGWAKSGKGDYANAITDLDKYLSMNPSSHAGYLERGLAKSRLNKESQAVEDYDKAISLKSDYALAFNNRASSKNSLGLYSSAIEDATKAINAEFDHKEWAYSNRGYARYKLGRYAEAIEDFNQALRVKPGYDYAVTWRKKAAEALAKE